MTPELKKIGNKLFLGTQKVELALVDDLKENVLFAKKMKEDITANFANANGGLRACADFKKNYATALQNTRGDDGTLKFLPADFALRRCRNFVY